MFTFSFHGNQTVTWYSVKTGRKLTAYARPVRYQVEAANESEAATKLRDLANTKVTTDQKRDVHIAGKVNILDNGKIIKSFNME